MFAASAHPAPAVQGGQVQSILRSVRASLSQAGLAGPLLTISTMMLFVESERGFVLEDDVSSVSVKAVCGFGSAPVLLRSLLLRSAGCVILWVFLFCETHFSFRGCAPLFHRVAVFLRSISLDSVRLRRRAEWLLLFSPLAAGVEAAAPTLRLIPQLP